MLIDICPRAHQHYVDLPVLGSILEEFTTWLCNQGYAWGTVRNTLGASRQIDAFLRQQGIRCLNELSQDRLHAVAEHYHHVRPKVASTAHQIVQFLEGSGHLTPLISPPKDTASRELDIYGTYLRTVRGLSETTIQCQVFYLRSFLEHIGFNRSERALTVLTPKDIERFLCASSARLNRYTLQHLVGYLRNFLRYQFERGALPHPLHTMIDTPRIYRLEQLPRCLGWDTVRALLESVDRTNAYGLRDYAILFLAAAYGLRSCEIVSLTLDDIDWRGRVIRIRQGKTGQHLLLPLTDVAGDVLVNYLTRGRPNHRCRNLFLRVRAPSGPLKPTAVSEVFQHRVRLSGLAIPFQGSHCLRHSYAVHLLRQGTAVKVIGDLLGHRNPDSTGVYLRLAVDDLRNVALPVPDVLADNVLRKRREITKSQPISPGRAKISTFHITTSSPWNSCLADPVRNYLQLKRSLGRGYANEGRALHGLDAFLVAHYPLANEFTGEMFNSWRTTVDHLSPTVQRQRLHIVRNFCLYNQRTQPQAFLPDPLTFPTPRPYCAPYILSESQIAHILRAAQNLRPVRRCPLRPQTVRIAILLLYTSGLRRGELLRLTLSDFNAAEATLWIHATKFHKSRLVPLSPSVAAELTKHLALRRNTGLPMEPASALIWNGYGGGGGKAYTDKLTYNWTTLCSSLGILTRQGRPPRLHDMRHSFAVNVLRRWYQQGENVQTMLPQLSTYMGHVSIVSTHYYLPFVEELRSEANARFHQSFGRLLESNIKDTQQKDLENPMKGDA